VFLKAFAHPYDPQLAKFSTYVYSIAANALKNYYRSAALRGNIMILGEPDEDFPDETDLLGGLIALEEYNDLKTALTQLPERQYETVYRRYHLNESFKEIGTALHTSESNARKLHFEAIKKLKKILERPNETASRVYAQTKDK
jgi:RNA polymerase sigma factor (sigma-70 family)